MVYTLLIKATPFDAGMMVQKKLGHLPVKIRFLRTTDRKPDVETLVEVILEKWGVDSIDEHEQNQLYEAVAGWFNADLGRKAPFPSCSLLHFNFRDDGGGLARGASGWR